MIKQNFTIVCDSAVLDKETGNLYLLGIFDNIKTSKFPAAHPLLTVVTNFGGGQGEHNHKIVIRHETGGEIANLEGKINFGSGERAQYIGKFRGIPFAIPGEYTVEVFIDEVLQPLKASFKVVLA